MYDEEEKRKLANYIRNISKDNPDIFTEERIQQAIEKFKDDPDEISVIAKKINLAADTFVKEKRKEQEYLDSLKQKFNNGEYVNTNVLNLNITTLSYEEMEKLFFHHSWKKYLESYDKNGMKPVIGDNSDGIDPEASIFFSKGTEGVLELWDVWLKWRLNRQNNPQFDGATPEEIKITNSRFSNDEITEEERKKWCYWIDYFKNKKYLDNPTMLEKLYEFQYTEMINSDYLIMNLKENEDFMFDQIDIKKQWAITKAKETGKNIDPLTSSQYGYYSDFSTAVADKWNMQTIPGKNITIEPDRLKRLTVNGKTDVFSIVKFMYDKYQREVSKEKQIKFDILHSYVKYISEKKLSQEKTIGDTFIEHKQEIKIHPSPFQTNTNNESKADENKKETKKVFDQRSQIEIQYAQQIRGKNEIIKQKKQAQKLQEKQKVKISMKYNPNGSNRGYANTLVLSLFVSFFAGALFMVVYIIIGGTK